MYKVVGQAGAYCAWCRRGGLRQHHTNGISFSANGQRARSNNFLLDGQDNNDPTIAGPGLFSNLEAIGEYQVITNQYSAEYGRNAGAIVNIRVKSGTDAFHGVGTYFRRDDQNWTALDNIQRASGLTNPPKYLDSILGGQFEGPVIKNKIFFNVWTQREWVRQSSSYIGTGSTLRRHQPVSSYYSNISPLPQLLLLM